MKNYSKIKILFITLFSCFSFVKTSVALPAPSRIYLALWDGCEDACRGFTDYFQTEHMNAIIIKRDAKKDVNKIPQFIEEINQTKPDLLVTWGTMVTLKMVGTEQNAMSEGYASFIPTVFMVVSQPVESGLVSTFVAQGRNITGVSQMPSISEQLSSARTVLPFRKLGLIYNPLETNSVSVMEKIKKYSSIMNFELIERPIPITSQKKPDSSSLAGLVLDIIDHKADLIYLPPDAFVNANREIIYQTAASVGTPIFSASEGAVKSGNALFSYIYRYYTVGQMAAKKAITMLKTGTPAYEIPIETPHRGIFVFNMQVANKLDIYPPLSIIPIVDMINTEEK
ncbi:MAG: ABC transporter substrate-binding protein [Alphaproteobacteria bacterium]|nr:ABC transporter substrate-binding protein [Alphaproteobacteria bacterium]